jgi:hypothetical protein
LFRRGSLDRCCVPGANSVITNGPSDYTAGQLSWDGRIRRHEVGIQLGYEEQSPDSAGDAEGLFGFLQWRKRFDTR